MQEKDIILDVQGLYKLYGANKKTAYEMLARGADKNEILKRTGVTVAIDDVSFQVERGKIFVLIGLSGSGKSTVVRCLNRLLNPSAGKILFEGRDIGAFGRRELREFRRKKISMVFQSFGLMSHRDVLGNVA
ncbi:MAG: ATP-binding cassette domain-containing protein, partial [Christensenellales bacterium]